MDTPPNSTQKRLNVLQTPFCGELRSKKYYLRDAILTSAEDYHDASGHTWCYHTQMPIGPDGYRAAPEYCGPERACYRSGLVEPSPYVMLKPDDMNPEV